MALVPEGVDRGELTVVARRVLLDALGALGGQRDAVILVGAQAVYLRSVDAELRVASYTADGDLSIDPRQLDDQPLLEEAMRSAGFEVLDRGGRRQPGQWVRRERIGERTENIAVDLLVAESFLTSRRGRRGASIPPHSRFATRQVQGLELAAVDHDLMPVSSLDPDVDDRSIEVKVAGVAALLVAKAHKIGDRLTEPGQSRLADKDAGDVYRLMTTSDPYEIADRFAELLEHAEVGDVTRRGLFLLREQFGAPRTPGTNMAADALAGAVDEDTVRSTCRAFMELLPAD